jgi:hypothetical protein
MGSAVGSRLEARGGIRAALVEEGEVRAVDRVVALK